MVNRRFVLSGLGFCGFWAAYPAFANTPSEELNQNSISLLVSESEWMSVASQLVARLDHQQHLRILPMLGRGSVQALHDLSHLRSVDMALVPSDVIIYAEAQGLLSGGKDQFAYVASLQKLPIVLVARRDIANLTKLAGRKICTGPAQCGAFATGELVLGNLGIPFSRVAQSGPRAIRAMKDGRAEAALLLGTDGLSELDASQFHVLSLPLPKELQTYYAPALLTQDERSGLNQGQGDVETIAVSMALAVMNWPPGDAISKRLQRFAEVLWSSPDSQPSSTNLTADISGWKRHSSAVQALAAFNAKPAPSEGEGL